VPFIKAAGEIKTKPTQHSVKELRSIGIQPDILLCRSEQTLPESERRKIALFTNVPVPAVVSAVDLDNIYKIPLWLHEQGLDAHGGGQAALARPVRSICTNGRPVVDACDHPVDEVTIAIAGKYVEHSDAYKSLAEALRHGGLKQRIHRQAALDRE
jgi:CTP synthase